MPRYWGKISMGAWKGSEKKLALFNNRKFIRQIVAPLVNFHTSGSRAKSVNYCTLLCAN